MPKMRDQFGLILILELRPCLATKMHSFDLSFILLHFGPSTLFYLLYKLCYFYNSLTSFYLMTFVSQFDNLQIYLKHAENDYGIFRGVTTKVKVKMVICKMRTQRSFCKKSIR